MSDALAGALALHRAGRLDAAADAYEALLARTPAHADALHMLGLLRHQQGDHRVAATLIDRAIAAGAAGAIPVANAAAVALALGDAEAARRHARAALAIDAAHFGARLNLGLAAELAGDLDEALAALTVAHAARPADGRTAAALADVRERRDGHAAALPLRRALADAAPGDAAAQFALGRALYASSLPAQAAAVLAPIADRADAPRDTRLLLAAAQLDLGDVDASIATSRALLAAHPDYAEAHSNLLIALQHAPAIGPRELFEAHVDWAGRHAISGGADRAVGDGGAVAVSGRFPGDTSLAGGSVDRDDRDKKLPASTLRIGFVSPRLHQGPVATFLLPLLRALDRTAFDVVLYASDRYEDASSAALRALADDWVDIVPLDDDALARRVADDRIDVLFDLAGHAPANRLTAFARRLAPVQASWLDYFCTTGIAAIDAFLSDPVLTPPADDAFFRERVIRLPHGRLAYAPPDGVPDVAPRAPGPPRFASFNRVAKLNDEVAAAWSAILRAVPGSTLALQAGALADPDACRQVVARFASHGVDASRLVLRGFATHAQTMAAYRDVDIALDPYPFSGCATTCDALWMGVPVVTRRGDTLVSRQSASLLCAAGLDELVADDWDGYVARAIALASDAPRLASLRATLRDRARAGFADAGTFARDFEAAVRDAWRARASVAPR